MVAGGQGEDKVGALSKVDAFTSVGGDYLIHWEPDQDDKWRKEEFNPPPFFALLTELEYCISSSPAL